MDHCNFFTTKETNNIIRTIKEDTYEYRNFATLLYDIRFELARSRLMDTNIDKLSEHLIEEFSKFDKEQEGLITILQI